MTMSFKYAMVATECGQLKVFLSDEKEAFEPLKRNAKIQEESTIVFCFEPDGVFVEHARDTKIEVVSAFDGEDFGNRKGPL